MHGFYVVSFMVAAALSVCKGQQEKICDVSPKDRSVELGSSLELVCQTSCLNIGKIFWTLNSKNISESLSKTINSTHTVLSLRNVTQPRSTVVCHSSYMDQILGGVTISTYTKPENITCVLHYKKSDGVPDIFTCTWKHRMDSSQTINYTILHGKALKEICSSQVTSCTTEDRNTANKIFFDTKIVVIIRAKTAAWEVYSDPHFFKPLEILKINPPSSKVITPSSDHLSVKWGLTCPDEKCHCEVKYYKATESNDAAPKYLSRPLAHFNATIKEMESCVKYNISVRCAYEKGLWSNWDQEETVLTKLNNRHIKLQLWRKVSEQGTAGKRKVHLMWKGIPSTCEEVLNITVKQVLYKDNTSTDNYPYTSCGSFSCDVDVDQHAYRLHLAVSSNDSMLAEEPVHVPAVGETGLPQLSSILTTTHKGFIRVSWKAVPENPTGSYIIDWTHDGSQYYWKESGSTNATLFGLLQRKPYDITVTPLFNDSTGQSIHANRICSSVGVPELITVRIEEVRDKSAFVKWDTKSQETCIGVVTYKIFYEAQGLQLNITMDGNEDGVWLKDLKPDTQYSISVEATGFNETKMSNTMYFTTDKFDSKLISIFSFYGGIFVILVVCLGLTCAFQWKKFTEKPVPDPRLSSVAKWLTDGHQKMEGFFQPCTDQIENHIVTDECQRECGASHTFSQKLTNCDPSFNHSPENEPYEMFSETSETQLLSSPEGSLVFSSSQSSPYRSQDSAEHLLSRAEKSSKGDLGRKQEKMTQKSVYVSFNMFQHSGVR